MENSQENIVLRVEGLSKAYKKGVFASKDVSFSVKKGEIFALIGPNGAGKTTTIRMIATLLKPTEGDALVDGNSIISAPEKVRRCLTYLPDEAGAYKNMNGRQYTSCVSSHLFMVLSSLRSRMLSMRFTKYSNWASR